MNTWNLTDQDIIDAKKVEIISGEGEIGTVEIYTGKRSLRALRRRVNKECCGGDRWCGVKLDGEDIFV